MPAILGASIGRLRTASGVPQKRAARAVHAHPTRISKLETGQLAWHDRDIDILLPLYHVDPREIAKYRAWANTIRTSETWWPDNYDNESSGLDELLDLEPLERIRNYDIATVPELLQTPDYAREILQAAHEELPAEHIDRLLEARLARRHILSSGAPPEVWLIIEAAALRRQIGGPTIWRKQIHELLTILEMPTVRVQILDDRHHGAVLAQNAFSHIRFANPDLPDLVCIRQLTGTMCLADTDRYLQLLDELAAAANAPQRTPEILRDLLR